MPKEIIENINTKDQFQLVVNDSKKFNKSFVNLALELAFLGWATNFKFNGFSIVKNVKDSFSFTLKAQSLQTLKDTEIRVVGNYILVRGYLCSFQQVVLDFNGSVSSDIAKHRLTLLSNFIEFIKNTEFIELFWYDRNETLDDYSSYFRQLDRVRENIHTEDKQGELVTQRLRDELEEAMQEIIDKKRTRIRESFLNISVVCNGKTVEAVEDAISRLESKRNMILKSITDAQINSQEVKGEHLHWFLTNFIALDARF
jgi:hypothetical protein